MSEHQIQHNTAMTKALMDALKVIAEKITRIVEAVLKIPDLIKGVAQEISNSSNRVIQARGEMEIFSRLANAASKKILMKSEKEAICELQKQLEDDFAIIRDRNDKIQAQLNADANQRIQNLDQALLMLPGKFPPCYGASLDQLSDFLRCLDSVASTTFSKRAGLLVDKSAECSTRIGHFLDGREKFAKGYENYIYSDSNLTTRTIYLPITVIKINYAGDKSKRFMYVHREKNTDQDATDLIKSSAVDMLLNGINPTIADMNFDSEKSYAKEELLKADVNHSDRDCLNSLNDILRNSKIKTLS